MPELPEVETTMRGVRPFVEGRVVKQAVVRERRLRWPVPRDFNQKIEGLKIKSVSRRAKYILFETGNGFVMIHLGMSGRLRVLPKDTPPLKHDHLDLVLSSGKILRFHDPRRFGSVLWITGLPSEHRLLAALGPEPFDQELKPEYLYRLSRGKKVTVKQFIMDGKIVVGVGNIYASEALFRAGIRPGRAAGRVSHIAFARLLGEIRAVLSEAIEAGGTTLRDYSRVNGEPGYFEQSLNVYERAGLPCVNCEKIVQRKVIGQRASYYCPRCQT